MPRKLSRRTVLRGFGTALALPWLEAMSGNSGALSSWGSEIINPFDPTNGMGSVSHPATTTRMAFFFVPNGIHMPDWKPRLSEESEQEESDQRTEFELGSMMESLAPLKEKLNIFGGLSLRNADALGNGPGDHARSSAAFLTGAHPHKTKGANIRNGISVDQIAASAIGHLTKLRSLELGIEASAVAGDCDSGYSCAYTSNIAWRDEKSPLPKEVNPAAVFERLFGSPVEQETRQALAKRESRRKSVLDFVSEDARSLNRQLGNSDRHKLDEYFYAVREIERRIVSTDKLDQTESDALSFSRPSGVPVKFDEHAKLMMDMLVLAFQTDSTRVGTFAFANEGSNRVYRHLGIRDGHHIISHHGNAHEKQQMISQINQFHLELFSHFLTRLDRIDEGGRSLLDNSMILYGSGIADGNTHSHHNLPIMMAGSGGGQIATGRFIRCRKKTPLTNLYCSMLQRVGVTDPAVGDSEGPLEELEPA